MVELVRGSTTIECRSELGKVVDPDPLIDDQPAVGVQVTIYWAVMM